MNPAALMRVLLLVEDEVDRREDGKAPDSRYDLALDVLGDLGDALGEGRDAGNHVPSRSEVEPGMQGGFWDVVRGLVSIPLFGLAALLLGLAFLIGGKVARQAAAESIKLVWGRAP